MRGGHPACTSGEDADGAATSGGSDSPTRPDVATRLTARRATRRGRRSGAPRRTGSRPLESRADRGGAPAGRGGSSRRARLLRAAAAIAALHCQAARAEDTDWPQIIRLYDLLEGLDPSPIVSLNRAVAVAMVDGPRVALALIDALAGELDGYHLFHAARADLLRRLGSSTEAANSYGRALTLVTNESERRFLERRLREVRQT